MARAGDKVDTDLLVSDLVESNLSRGLQVKHPVCFDCFDKLLTKLDGKMKEQKDQQTIFSHQLMQLEKEIK